jgi:hypothetical protein
MLRLCIKNRMYFMGLMAIRLSSEVFVVSSFRRKDTAVSMDLMVVPESQHSKDSDTK